MGRSPEPESAATNTCLGADPSSIPAAKPSRASIESAVASIMAAALNLDAVDPGDELILLGGDSMQARLVCSRIANEFGIRIQVASILAGTVAEIAADVDAALGGAAV